MQNILDNVGKRLGDIRDLPEELTAQLQFTKIKGLEQQIIHVIKSFDGIANLDEILVGLYREFNIIQDRIFLSNKIYRMTKNGRVISIKGRKGVYKLNQ